MISVYVGTCLSNSQAELALANSIRRHSAAEYQIHWMRGGVFEGWNQEGWGTPFTPFRWLVPQLQNYKGKALYVDVDVLLRAPIEDLFNIELEGKAVCSLVGNYSVMVMDCSKFAELPYKASLEEFKTRSCRPPFRGVFNSYVQMLEDSNLVKPLEPKWNCLDGTNIEWTQANLIHYTRKDTQPWRPYPERIQYQPHEIPELEILWRTYVGKIFSTENCQTSMSRHGVCA